MRSRAYSTPVMLKDKDERESWIEDEELVSTKKSTMWQNFTTVQQKKKGRISDQTHGYKLASDWLWGGGAISYLAVLAFDQGLRSSYYLQGDKAAHLLWDRVLHEAEEGRARVATTLST